IEQSESKVVFALVATEETLKKYPFDFNLRIAYEVVNNELKVSWHVQNQGNESMYFSIGAHPAFSTKLAADDEFSDYYLHLEHNEGIETLLFDQHKGQVFEEKEVIMEKLKLLPLSADLFAQYGALIIEGETGITLASYNHDREVEVKFNNFPYVGIWTAVKQDGTPGDFVCIEPWYGHGDVVLAPQEIKDKKGIQTLGAHEAFEASYQMFFR
ncbi:MAG: aldose 1-epimerase family protein, partial [Turicibacter sp.]